MVAHIEVDGGRTSKHTPPRPVVYSVIAVLLTDCLERPIIFRVAKLFAKLCWDDCESDLNQLSYENRKSTRM